MLVDGDRCVEAWLMDKGLQGPKLKSGLVATSGYVSHPSSHLQEASLSALEKWELRSLDIRNAFLRAGNSNCEVNLRSPT